MNGVKVGQLWQDMDKRSNGRTLRVVTIVEVGDPLNHYAVCRVGASDRTVKIRLRRMKPGSTGYKLVRDENGNLINGQETA